MTSETHQPKRRMTGERIAIAVLSGLLLVLFIVVISVALHPRVKTEVINRTVTVQKNVDQQANLAHLGLCWNVTYGSAGGYVQNVYLSAPSDNGGVVSCASGTFISVAP